MTEGPGTRKVPGPEVGLVLASSGGQKRGFNHKNPCRLLIRRSPDQEGEGVFVSKSGICVSDNNRKIHEGRYAMNGRPP
jgi:hypothetical protein